MRRAFLAIICGAALLANSMACDADPASDKEMADRYSQAAQSGDSDAQFYLAALYSAGVGRPRSDEEAFRWFSRAADQGHSHAMLVIAGIHAVGRGTQKDNLNAYKWAYIVSVGSRVDEFRNGSRQLIGVLDTRMTREEIDKAKAEADRWRAAPSQAKAAVAADALTRDSTSSQPTAASKQSPDNTASSSADSGNSPRVPGIKN